MDKTINVKVEEIKQITPRVKEFKLKEINGKELSSFSSGSHVDTYIDLEYGSICRKYSITNSSNNASYKIAILLSETSKGGSTYWHHHMKVGDSIRISYPKNYFSLSFSAKHHVFYAAGIGITPFLSMMNELKSKQISFELHYTTPFKRLCTYYDTIIEQYGKESHFYFTKENPSNRLKVSSLLKHPIGTHVYFCGPEQFINEFSQAAISIGYPKSTIHFEHFKQPKINHSESFEVILSSGKTATVPKDKTLLDVLLQQGIKVPYSCRVGRCGTCQLNVLNGKIDHRDHFLNEEQKKNQNTILTCVSRSISKRIVLDV